MPVRVFNSIGKWACQQCITLNEKNLICDFLQISNRCCWDVRFFPKVGRRPDERFRPFSEKFPKTAKDCRRFPTEIRRCFDWKPIKGKFIYFTTLTYELHENREKKQNAHQFKNKRNQWLHNVLTLAFVTSSTISHRKNAPITIFLSGEIIFLYV